MKTDLTLSQMAVELERRNAAKRDFVANTTQLHVEPSGGAIALTVPKENAASEIISLDEGEIFREQALAHYKIPREYGDRIRIAHPRLYAATLNTFFHKEPTRRMVRVLDGKARAFLSDRYRPLDNFDLANAVLPELMGHESIRIESTSFTERRFYLKAVLPKIEAEVKVGDPVQIGIMVSNSEVGSGALQVAPLVFRLVCLNGMISPDYGQRRYHVGKRASETEDAFEMYSDKTKQLDDAAFFSKVRDTVRGVLTHDVLNKLVEKMREATGQKLEAKNLAAVVEVTAKTFGYTEGTAGGILRHLIEGGDLSRYGLMNAITRQSQDENSYERATQLELDGARVLELPKTDWRLIAEAA
jgi:hypothetical protein